MRSETYMSKINLQRGKLTVENRKSRQKKTDMLRSIGKQSGESGELVQEKKWYAMVGSICRKGKF